MRIEIALPTSLAFFVAGDILLQQFTELPGTVWLFFAGAAGAILFALAARTRARPPAAMSCCLAAAAAMGFVYAASSAGLRLADALAPADEGRDVRVQGVVASLPAEFDGGTRFTFAVERVLAPRVAVPARIALSWYEPPLAVLPAQRWEMSVKLHRPHGSLNPAGFDAEAWLLEAGIRAQGTVRTARALEAPRLIDEFVWQFDPLIDRARARLRARLQRILQGRRYGDVIVALVMGDQGPIREEDWALFNRTGISHLVSISGLHITMIAAAVAVAAGAVWRRIPRLLRVATLPTARALAAIVGGLAYCLLAGWGVPAQRTLIMLGVVALGTCWRARLGAATILAAAAALVCLWDPWAVLAAGFWLSFGAVACIFLALSGRLAPEPGWRAALREALRVQAVITVGQVPLTLAIFGQVSLVAPVANAVAIPAVSYLVAPLALAGAGLSVLGAPGMWLAVPLLEAAETLFRLLATFLLWLTQTDFSWFALPMPPAWTFGCAAAGCGWLLAPAGAPLRLLGLTGLLPMLLWPVERPGAGELWVTALDIGQGMSLVLESAHSTVVFDTGPRYTPDSDAGGRVLVPYLRARGVRRVDVLVVSHQDIDHAGGAAALLRALPVTRVWSSVEAGNRLLDGAPDVRRCAAGDALDLADLHLQMLAPPETVYANPRASTNARSCVVLAQLGAHRVLLTGDVPARQERQLVAATSVLAPERPVDVLVAPHHGSRTSSSEALIAAANPRWVSMQLGYRNRFGHPHAQVVQRYRDHRVTIVRSDESGAARWRLGSAEGAGPERWRIDHARYWNDRPAENSENGESHFPPSISPLPRGRGGRGEGDDVSHHRNTAKMPLVEESEHGDEQDR